VFRTVRVETGKHSDRITALAVDGKDVKDARDLARKIGAMAPGTAVRLAVLHNGETKTMSLTLGQLPDQRQASAGEQQGTTENGGPRLGLTLAPANDVDGAGNRGVAVIAVDPSGPAAEHGVKEGDVILDVAGKAVSKPAEVRHQLADLRKDGKHAVLMRIKSADNTRFIAARILSASASCLAAASKSPCRRRMSPAARQP
jgi:serine protease Do